MPQSDKIRGKRADEGQWKICKKAAASAVRSVGGHAVVLEMLSLIVVFVVTFLLVEWITSKPKNYPPGPPCLPIVGSVLFVETRNFHFYLEKVKKSYGPVVGLKFGRTAVIGVSGTKEIREVLTRQEFQGRPDFPLAEKGIMFSEGEFWTTQRRFTIRHLREFGFGKKSTEQEVVQEAEEFCEKVLRGKEVVQVSGLFTVSAINVLWAMVGGQRYSHEDKEFKVLLELLQRTFRTGNVTGGLLTSYAFLGKIFGRFGYFAERLNLKTKLEEFLQDAINSHKASKTDEHRDFMDVYLSEIEKPLGHPSFSEKTLRDICVDLFSAGSESVGNTIGFCLLYCVLYPEWQRQLHQEIQQNSAFTPYLDNKQKFPKMEAFLSEVMRCNSIAAIAVPHKATKDTELGGYFVPKDAWLVVSLWGALQDKEVWEQADKFRPERFLDENGKYRNNVGWLPLFGLGKRICPGETLAKSIVFVFLITLIQKFEFSIPEGHPKPSTICLPGFTNAPSPFHVKITKR